VSDSAAPAAGIVAWPTDEPYDDVALGSLKSGKEAEVFLVERRYATSGTRLLAYKRYRPRYPEKGELRELGFRKATRYRGDATYKFGWNLKRRERLALMSGSRFGHELAGTLWPYQEWVMLRRAWRAGASVPYPVEHVHDGVLMEFIGDASSAAPRLAQARLDTDAVAQAWTQLLDSLRAMTAAGIVHADLSVYNMLWWEGRLVIIDLPQAIEFSSNPDAYTILHRDLTNVATWFARRGLDVEVEELYAELVVLAM
jgi:RIO kinase 1